MASEPEDVVYVHGLWLSGRESLFLRRRLEREHGYRVHLFRYPTVSASMVDITGRLRAFVQDLQPRPLHFVGHSLGGLVIYRFLERYPEWVEPGGGRVVFLGTPSVASQAAVSAARSRVLASLIGRCAGEELVTNQQRQWTARRDLGKIGRAHV